MLTGRSLQRISTKSIRSSWCRPVRAISSRAHIDQTPLYDRKPPWWTRWTYFLIGTNLLVTAAACELTWDYWTEWQDAPDASRGQTGSAETADSEKTGQYVLRPWYVRAGFALGQFSLGVMVGSFLFSSRARVVRRLWILPPPSTSVQPLVGKMAVAKDAGGRRLRIQSAIHLWNQGDEYPLRDCTLGRGANDKAVTFTVEGRRGHFFVDLEDAAINGHKLSLTKSAEELYSSWYGAEKGKKLRTDERWKKR